MSDLSQLFVFGRSTCGPPISEGYFPCSGLLRLLLFFFFTSSFFISCFNNFAFSAVGLSGFGAKF